LRGGEQDENVSAVIPIFTSNEVNAASISTPDSKIYRFVKVHEDVPKSELYPSLLRNSLKEYKEYSLEDRVQHSFVVGEILFKLEQSQSWYELFHRISALIEEDDDLEVSDLSRVFGDILEKWPESRETVHRHLIDIAVLSTESHPLDRETAIKVLSSAEIGEVVLTSAESLWSTVAGGISLYVNDLAKELANRGVSVTVVVPLFADDKEEILQKYKPRDTGKRFTVTYNADESEHQEVKIYEAKIDKVRVLYLENPVYFNALQNGGQSVYGGDNRQKLRFARMLSLGTLLAIREMNIDARIIQTNTWGPAYIKDYLDGWSYHQDNRDKRLRGDPHLRKTRIVSVIHSATTSHQGLIKENTWHDAYEMIRHDLVLDAPYDPNDPWIQRKQTMPRNNNIINPMFSLVIGGDKVIVVSEPYKKRILRGSAGGNDDHDEFGGLADAIRSRIAHLKGIPNGFDLVGRQRQWMGELMEHDESLREILQTHGYAEPISFFEIGDDMARRKIAKQIFQNSHFKLKLQNKFWLRQDSSEFNAFIYSMLHRISEEKGHALLLADVFDINKSGSAFKMSGAFGQMGVEDLFEHYPPNPLMLLGYLSWY